MRPATLAATLCLLAPAAHAQTAPQPGALAPGAGGAAVVVAPAAPSAADPARVADAHVAAALATGDSAFERRAVLPVASGTVVRYVQRYRGVLVRDGGAAVLVSPAGRVIAVNDFSARALPRATPGIDARAAARAARAHVGGADPGDDLARTFLVWTRELGAPQLVYECDFAVPEENMADAPRVLVRARDGRVLLRENRALAFRARVFRANPASTPELVDVELPGLTDGAAGLVGADIDSFNCIDTGRIYTVSGTRLHLCTPTRTAMPNAAGVYEFDTTMPNLLDDPYAELSMYFHATDALAFMRNLGLQSLRSRPLRTVANVRFPWRGELNAGTNTTGPLYPWDNAAFVPGRPPNFLGEIYGAGRDSLVFGQGDGTDYAYDGDVVAHEIGHAVVASTAEFGGHRLDEYGTDNAPRALNEAIADYFAAARAGDPRIGEYAGARGWGGGEIRALTSEAVYPDRLRGEEHMDSVPFSSALWAARVAVGPAFDRAVYEALAMAPTDPSMGGLAQLVHEAAMRLVPADAARVRDALNARGLLPAAPRAALYNPNGRGFFMVPGSPRDASPYTPGYFQFKVSAPAGTYAASLELQVYANTPVTLRMFVRRGEPVRFAYPEPEQIEVTADAESDVDGLTNQRLRGTVEFPATTTAGFVYVAIAAVDSTQAYASGLRISLQRRTVTPTADAGADAGAGGDGGGALTTVGGGCAVAARPGGARPAGRSALAAAGLALAAAALATARARSRSRTR